MHDWTRPTLGQIIHTLLLISTLVESPKNFQGCEVVSRVKKQKKIHQKNQHSYLKNNHSKHRLHRHRQSCSSWNKYRCASIRPSDIIHALSQDDPALYGVRILHVSPSIAIERHMKSFSLFQHRRTEFKLVTKNHHATEKSAIPLPARLKSSCLSTSPAGKMAQKAHDARETVTGSKGTYEVIAESPELVLARLRTPMTQRVSDEKSRHAAPPRKLSFDTQKSVAFQVRLRDIEARHGVARPKSQFQVMGCSSREYFEFDGSSHCLLGNVLNREVRGRDCHLSHLHAWFLGGAQKADNLIPTTAGCNYEILAAVEKPIFYLLTQKKYKEFSVTVHITFEGDSKIPSKLDYHISADGHGPFIVHFDPKNPRTPTYDDHLMMINFFEMALSPKPSGFGR